LARGKREKKQSIGTAGIALIVIGAALVVLLAMFVVTGVKVARSNRIYPNVSVSGVSVGGMTYDEAETALESANLKTAGDVNITVALTDSVSVTATGADAGYARNASEAAELALRYGRTGNFFSNTVSYLKSRGKSVDLSSEGIDNFDESGVKQRIADAAKKADRKAVAATYKVTATDVSIVKGVSGYTVPQNDVYDYIRTTLQSGKTGTISTDEFSDKKLTGEAAAGVDIGKIYDEVHVEAKNAEYDKTSGGVTDGVTGVSFDKDAAQKAYDAAAEGQTVTIALVKTEPEVTTESIKSLLFRDTLASKTTTMYSSSSNRLNNVTLAAKAMNGTVLNPGETFSYNDTLGERTTAKGYKPAGAYVGGETVDQVGGGICQGSSTLYWCVLKSGLEVVDRSNHMYAVAYLPLGEDATVNWGTVDFKFKNNTDYPIKIEASVANKELTVTIYGTNVSGDTYDIESDLIKTIDYDEVKKEDAGVAEGQTEVKTSGHKGYVAETYLLHYNSAGKLISRDFIAKDTYRKQDRVILVPVGTLTPSSGASSSGASSSESSSSESSGGTSSGSSGESSSSTPESESPSSVPAAQ